MSIVRQLLLEFPLSMRYYQTGFRRVRIVGLPARAQLATSQAAVRNETEKERERTRAQARRWYGTGANTI